MTGRELPGWVELDDGVLVGIGTLVSVRERQAEQAGAIGRPEQLVRTQPGTGDGARVRAVGIGDHEERVGIGGVSIPYICEARAVRRPGQAVLILGAVRHVAEVPSVCVDDVYVAPVADTPRQEREPPTVRRPCGLRPRPGSTSSDRTSLYP